MPRKCTVCFHPNVRQINQAIAAGTSFRNIAQQHGIKDHTAVYRHAETHLGVDLRAVAAEKRIEEAVDVHREYNEFLSDAKRLKDAAMAYLSDPDDPLKTLITPHADEIMVIYLDWNDMTEGDNPKPRRKRAQLSELLRTLKAETDWDPQGVKVTHVDLRKYALDCLTRAESLADKFAQLAGLYKSPQENKPADRLTDAVNKIMQMEGMSFADALQYIFDSQRERGVIMWNDDVIRSVAAANGVQLQTQELGRVG